MERRSNCSESSPERIAVGYIVFIIIRTLRVIGAIAAAVAAAAAGEREEGEEDRSFHRVGKGTALRRFEVNSVERPGRQLFQLVTVGEFESDS